MYRRQDTGWLSGAYVAGYGIHAQNNVMQTAAFDLEDDVRKKAKRLINS